MSSDLDELFTAYGSDKTRNGYAPVYHSLLKNLREKPIVLLEIGIGTMVPGVHSSMVGYALEGYRPGGSLRAWRDWLPLADIHGADVQPDTQFDDEHRITTHLCDSTKPAMVDHFMNGELRAQIDVLIDDGSHVPHDQWQTFVNFWPHINRGGFYIIEDIWPGSPLLQSQYMTEIRKHVGPDGFVFAAALKDEREERSPILVISRR